MEGRLERTGVDVRLNAELTPEQANELKADVIMLAAGLKPDRAMADEFYNTAPRVFQIGDCIRAGRVVDAVTQGYYRAIDI